MAFMITITIMLSLLWSLFFFMPVLYLVGPQGNTGNLKACFGMKKGNRLDTVGGEGPGWRRIAASQTRLHLSALVHALSQRVTSNLSQA